MLIFLIPFLLFCYFRPDPQKTKWFCRYSGVWMGVFLPLAGCPLRIRGKEKFAKGQTYIVVCNHNALIDVPVSSPGIPGGNKTIAKIEFARIPIFGLMYQAGSILVDRKNENSRRESFTKMKEALDMGLHMCIYPEGTRNKTNEPLKPFHDGAFRLSLSTGKAIIPAIIFNSRKIMPPPPASISGPTGWVSLPGSRHAATRRKRRKPETTGFCPDAGLLSPSGRKSLRPSINIHCRCHRNTSSG
jgi:1-acyl-sn-glycerol-3-phosphate acyltransferase